MRLPLFLVATAGLALAAVGAPRDVAAAPRVAAVHAAGTEPAIAVSRRFASRAYPYTLALPPGWSAAAATTRFPGGDIDHTASYVDSFFAPDERLVFVLGRRTSTTLSAYARAHAAWLTANRPCRSLGPQRSATLAGSSARVASFACTGGVYGRTFVVKWVVVHRGLGLIVTQFSPDGRRAADRSVVAKLLRGLAWSP